MKEYVAETGGRYTYSDDVLNLQELALSLSAIFDGCSDFIISGCETDGARISDGYVWLGGAPCRLTRRSRPRSSPRPSRSPR